MRNGSSLLRMGLETTGQMGMGYLMNGLNTNSKSTIHFKLSGKESILLER